MTGLRLHASSPPDHVNKRDLDPGLIRAAGTVRGPQLYHDRPMNDLLLDAVHRSEEADQRFCDAVLEREVYMLFAGLERVNGAAGVGRGDES